MDIFLSILILVAFYYINNKLTVFVKNFEDQLELINDRLRYIEKNLEQKDKFNDALVNRIVRIQMDIANNTAMHLEEKFSKDEKKTWPIRNVYRSFPNSVVWAFCSDGMQYGEIILDFPSLCLGSDGFLDVDASKLISANTGSYFEESKEKQFIIQKGVIVDMYIFEKGLLSSEDSLFKRFAWIDSVKKEDDDYNGVVKFIVTLKFMLAVSSERIKFGPYPISEEITTRTIEIHELFNPFKCIPDDEELNSNVED